MGSVISRGRKYSPKQLVATKNPNNSVEHARFACGGASDQSTTYVEGYVCKENEIRENEMKVFDVGEHGKVLLVKQKGKISALGTKCTHYGAPLVNGHLGQGRIRCQWHGACFNINTGDIEDFPGLDSLPCYEVNVVDGDVRVRADRELLIKNKQVKPYIRPPLFSQKTIIVLGGGAAGATCAETLRQNGYAGKVILITGEKYLPYDRIKLSKTLNMDVSQITLRSKQFYEERHITVLLDSEVLSVDIEGKTVKLKETNIVYDYDKIFIGTGATPRRLTVPGSNLDNIFVLRTYDDAQKISEQLSPDKNVIIVGTSFIGMETAAYCVDKVKSVTVVGRDGIPFKKIFGPDVSKKLYSLFKEKGVRFRLKSNVIKFEGEDGVLKKAILNDETELDADICIVGVGVLPNTSFLPKAGIKHGKYGALDVNQYMETSIRGMYAGGDVASAPVLGQKASIGHWGLASYHGRIAALNMLGMRKPSKAVPFFWTVLFGKSVRYAGYAPHFDDIIIDGNVEEFKFIVFLCFGENVAAVCTMDRDPLAAKYAEYLYEGKQLHKEAITEWLQ